MPIFSYLILKVFYISPGPGSGPNSGGTITWPQFPTYGPQGYTGTAFIIQIFLWVLQVIAYPFEWIFYGIGNGIGTGFQNLFAGLFNMVTSVYSSSTQSFAFAGPFAPILVTFVWGAALVILVFFLLFAFHMFVQDAEEDTGT